MPKFALAPAVSLLALSLLAACGGGGNSAAPMPAGGGGLSATSPGTAAGTDTASTGTNTGAGSDSGSGSVTTPPPAPTLAAATEIVDGTGIGAQQWNDGSSGNGGQGKPIGTLSCAAPGASYSYAHLSIFLNGKQLALPANIGVVAPTMELQAGCVYPVHTSDTTGKIRFDTAGTYTLGQFFSVWGRPLGAANVAGITGLPVTAYINNGGSLVQYSGDLASIPLTAHAEITLLIGTPVAQIPTYRWTDPPPLSGNPLWILADGTIGAPTWPDGVTASGGFDGRTIDDIVCAPGMSQDYHVHPHLAIIKDGKMLAIARYIGLTNACDYEIHTHDSTGVLHVEAPGFKRFTLGKFFDVWGQPLSSTNVAGLTGEPIAVYINDGGDVRQYTGDPREIELISHRSITIQIGSRLDAIPTYHWDTLQ